MRKSIVLVTGATGFLGGRLVDELTRQGFRVRGLARKHSNTEKLRAATIETFFGDVRDLLSVKKAVTDVDVVIHAAADTSGDAAGGKLTTVIGTRNVLNAAMEKGVKQFIYLSSCSVYGIADCQAGQRIDESGPLERFPEARGHYSNAKFEAERSVREAMNKGLINITCLRPGTIWGPGGETFTPMMGFKIGARLIGIIGSRGFVLPLVYIDNLVSAIITSIGHPGACNKIFNVVDPQKVDKKTYTNAVLKPLLPDNLFFTIPYRALHAAVGCQEILCRVLGRKPFVTRYRLISSQRPVIYDAGKIERELCWFPPVRFNDAVHDLFQYEQSRQLRNSGV